MREIAVSTLKEAINNDVCLVDVRATEDFVISFVKGAVNLVLNNHFSNRLNHFISENKVVIIAQEEQRETVTKALGAIADKELSVCFSNIIDWQEHDIPLDMVIDVDTYELKLDLKHDERALIIDVRDHADYDEEHVAGATNMPVFDMTDPLVLSQIDENLNIYMHCNGGTRSVLACSILKKHGFHNIRNIEGGMKAIRKEEDIPLKEKKAQIN